MKNALYFTFEALLALKTFNFSFWVLGHVAKQLDEKDKVNFKIYDVPIWLINNCNTNIDQYLDKCRQWDNEIWSFNRIKHEKSNTKSGG